MKGFENSYDPMSIKIIFLGTSAGVPTKERNVTSILLVRKGEYIFFDFGEGTQRQLFTIGMGFISKMKIFITHTHGDHILGLPGLLQTLCLFKRTAPLNIYGPPQLASFIDFMIDFLNIDLTFEIKFHPVRDGDLFDFKEYYIKALRNKHAGLSFSYMFKEYDKPGRFNVELALKRGVPKTIWSKLARGEDVRINDKIFKASEYLIPPAIRGRKIVISGDTMPFQEMVSFAKGADVLIHEATYSKKFFDRSLKTQHTVAEDAAKIAKEANVKILVLTHLSARYGDPNELLLEARRIFPATFIASDFDIIEIPYIGRIIKKLHGITA